MKSKGLHLLVALALAAGVAGCGGDAETTATTEPVPKPESTRVAPAKTPRQAVLGWWRYVQANDPERAREFYLDPPSLPDLAGQFNFLGDSVEGELTVLSSEAEDGTTRVRARWSPTDGEPRQVTLRLREQGGEWKLLDARFLDETVAEMQGEE